MLQLRESKHYSGDYLEADIFPVRPCGKGRGKKLKPSTETQKRLNAKNAARRLTWLIQANFTEKDLYIGLSYEQGTTVTPEQGKRDLQNFLRKARYRCAKLGVEFKYITCTERGKRSGRIHHHVICSGELGREVLESLWLKGYANSRRLQFTRTGAAGIAWYTCKEAGASISYRSYNCSKNLKKPEERKRDGRVSAKKLAELRGDYCNAELFEKLYPGYEFVDADPYWDMYNIDGNGEAERIDFPYITIRMIKKDSAYIMRDKDRM